MLLKDNMNWPLILVKTNEWAGKRLDGCGESLGCENGTQLKWAGRFPARWEPEDV